MRRFRGQNRLDSAIQVVHCAGWDCTEWLFVGPDDEADRTFADGKERVICTKCKRRLDAFGRSKRRKPPEK